MVKQQYITCLMPILLSMSLSFFTPPVYSFPKTDLDYMQLPPFCKARASGPKSASWKYWEKQLGRKNFIHIHHLCSGMDYINKARMMSSRKKQFPRILTAASGGIDYVLDRTPQSFILYPLMIAQKAEIALLLKKPESAIVLLDRAIQANPRYSPAYAKLSDIYIQKGKKKKAQEVILQGLEQKPNSKLLQLKLKKLM